MNTNALRIAEALEKCDWAGCSIGNKEILRGAVAELRVLSTLPIAVEGKVKALEWRVCKSGGLSAETIYGTYFAASLSSDFATLKLDRRLMAEVSSVEEAQKLAQQDYEGAILSALVSSPGKDGGQDGRTISGETVLGMPVKAYMEETEFGGKFATHWSTIPARCKPIRLFAEDDVRARLFQSNSTRPCTCHPDDSPPNPCAQQYALSACRAAGKDGGQEVEVDADKQAAINLGAAVLARIEDPTAREIAIRNALTMASQAPSPNTRSDLYDADAFMADGGETPMTAAENVLAWLLVEKIGVPDDVGYSPNRAQEIIVRQLDQLREFERADPQPASTALVERLTKALEPFSFIAGELFANNYNDSDIVFSVQTKTEMGSTVKLDVAFSTFREARNALSASQSTSSEGER